MDVENPSPVPLVEGWQDMSTAPRGAEILVWNGRRRHVASFDKIEGEWVASFKTTTKRMPVRPHPTHWQLLPDEPAAQASEGGQNG